MENIKKEPNGNYTVEKYNNRNRKKWMNELNVRMEGRKERISELEIEKINKPSWTCGTITKYLNLYNWKTRTEEKDGMVEKVLKEITENIPNRAKT